MKINYLKISNVLSFKYVADMKDAAQINFNSDLNIMIGQNGAGKSTALEIINFIFRHIILTPYIFNQDLYANENAGMAENDRKQIISSYDTQKSVHGFRLDANWSSQNMPQTILISLSLDAIDRANLSVLQNAKSKLDIVAGRFSQIQDIDFAYQHNAFEITINVNPNRNYSFSVDNGKQDDGAFKYLQRYNYYKYLIQIHNRLNEQDTIETLKESFTLIGGYRNYNAFSPSVSLSTRAATQIENIRRGEFTKSTNAHDTSEPTIFNLVRIQVAEIQQRVNAYGGKTAAEAETEANRAEFLIRINSKLALINLKVKITLLDLNTWAYSFQFINLATNAVLNDINSLSAGQKSIIHLIFESYGRGDLKGGVIIIDEPELHLHYQLQFEYLRIIETLNSEQQCQYILVTHSDALISSLTIDKVIRFTLADDNSTKVMAPTLSQDQKTLIKILDTTRSTYALFAKTVLLVEGDSDRYFFRSVFQELYPHKSQEIAVLDIGGKSGFEKWSLFFKTYGLKTFYVGDFDNVFNLKFGDSPLIPAQKREDAKTQLTEAKLAGLSQTEKDRLATAYTTLSTAPDFLTTPPRLLWDALIDTYRTLSYIDKSTIVQRVITDTPAISTDIEAKYSEGVFILKLGAIEQYTETPHADIGRMIQFCSTLKTWLAVDNPATREIKLITKTIASA